MCEGYGKIATGRGDELRSYSLAAQEVIGDAQLCLVCAVTSQALTYKQCVSTLENEDKEKDRWHVYYFVNEG